MHFSTSIAELGWQTWYTAAVVIVMIVALVREWRSPEILLGSALAALLIPGILTPKEALSGFSNEGVLTIAALFIVAQGVQETGGLGHLAMTILGEARGLTNSLFKIMLPTVSISAFMNNTPVVAMFIPVVRKWAENNNLSPSKLLIPLSYASILGGVCTLIGTSSNLVISGMMTDHGFRAMGMFEISRIGIPIAIVGLVFMMTLGRKLLPERPDIKEMFAEEKREYLVEMVVAKGCPLIGKNIAEGGLRHLKGLFLVHIERRGKIIGPVPPSQIIDEGDLLLFTGVVSTIVDLTTIRGLEPADTTPLGNQSGKKIGDLRLFEVVISPSSPLVNVGVRAASFRGRYDATVIAVHRGGQRIASKVGDIVLRSGDTLLLEAPRDFAQRWYNSSHFYLVSQVGDVTRVRHEKTPWVLAVLAAMIALPALNILPMVVSAVGAAIVFVLLRALSSGSARRAVDLKVLIIIAAALGIGKAIETTGLATLIAEAVVSVASGFGPLAVLLGIMLLTNIFSELVTNKAAAALFFPIALSAASLIGADPRPFMISVAVAAASSFATPLGYQTNLIVYGPGGYRYSDFLRIGVPMNLISVITGALVIGFLWNI